MSEWHTSTLLDIVELIGGGTPKTSVDSYWNGDIPWLSVKDFNNNKRYVYSTEKHISQEGLENSSAKLLQKDDIIISARGTVGELAMISSPMAFNQSCYGVRGKRGIDQTFLYYLIKNSIRQLKAMTHGSVFDTITRDTFSNILVSLPDIKTQRAIALLLSNLDDKIEENELINQNLTEQFMVLYRQLMTSALKSKKVELQALCFFQEGYVNPVQTHPEYFDGDVKWLRAVDINESFIIDTSRTITKAGFESAKKSALLFKPWTIAISKSGTVGRLGIIADYMCGNRAVINIEVKEIENLPFIYAYLKSRQHEFAEMAVGSVQKNLYVSLLEPLIVNIPKDTDLAKFNNIGKAILNEVYNNCFENKRLSELRDSLLSKLMSGELDISNLNI